MAKRTAWLVVLLVQLPWAARAQIPAGPEFRINTYTTNVQADVSVASDASGNFVVAWHSPDVGSSYGVFGRRFSAAGAPLGAEFRANSLVAGDQLRPSVASDATGNFVVVWQSSYGQYGNMRGVFGQRFSAGGTPLGAEFQVNAYSTTFSPFPSVASDASGNFLVAWQYRYQDGSDYGVFGQRFSAAGTRRGGEFRVNTYTTSIQRDPAVALDANGNFVVAWSSDTPSGGPSDVVGQRFSATGAPLGAEFRVNTVIMDWQLGPSVASDAGGNFVVAWSSYRQDQSDWGVFAQRFSAAGAPLGAEFQVNTYTTRAQVATSVASDAGGNFVVVWQSLGQDGSGFGVFARRFSATGAPRGAEFQVNTYTSGTQGGPSVASDANGNFVVAWFSYGQDGSREGIFGQRFGGLHAAALAVDTVADPGANGNGVLEPGESIDARPSWTNVSGTAQAFAGFLSDMAGPPGGSYTVSDPSGDYGTVADAATGACLDCYRVVVSAPPVRPVLHWDASVLETIAPAAQGQTQRWRLHVGDSFTDVPRTNPFYRFVETLLHHDVTAGCAPTQYCPGSSTTREQMAVFVLVAKEGAGFQPPACTTPIYNDVPASSPFCAFIEELSRRGVVAGCGSGDYCPQTAVTREQMAVFVLLTLDPALNPPACVAGSELFADVPASSGFCRWIEELARRGVVTGCGGGNYCPGASVTREQMAVFISATFGLLLYGP